MKAILSIQSEVAYGHVGNSAAVLPLQRLGFEVWPVNTVQLGHHPGYGRFRGYHVDTEKLSAVLNGVLDRAPLSNCVGMIGGYLGDAAMAGPMLKALDHVTSERQDLVFLLDPVIGDDGAGVFVRSEVPEAIAERLLPRASIITPNRFELAYLSGLEVGDLDQARQATERLLERGPHLVVATGLPCPGSQNDLSMLAVSRDERWLIRTPKLQRAFSGCGDAFSALFLGHYLLAPDLKSAFERAASAVFSLLDLTEQSGEDELSLVAAQDLLADPDIHFSATQI